MKNLTVLGIDPGSRVLGFGVITKVDSKIICIKHGSLQFDIEKDSNARLVEVYESVKTIIEKYQPDHLAIEKIFFAKNALSALKLGQARGVVLLLAGLFKLPIHEYSPNEVKLNVVGRGHADKEQVSRMVTLLTGVTDFATFDSSDALAIAICHLHAYIYKSRIEKALNSP